MNFKKMVVFNWLMVVSMQVMVFGWTNILVKQYTEFDFDENAVEAKKWGKSLNEEQEKSLNRDDHRAFNIFNTNWHKVNLYLREEKGQIITDKKILLQKGYPEKINEIITSFDYVLDKLPFKKNLYVYRRVNENFFGLNMNLRNNNQIDIDLSKQIINQYQNKIFKQYGYTSTSLSRNLQQSFFNKSMFPILMKIKITPNIKAIYLGEISDHPEELELLLKRGYNFKYEKFSIINEQGHQTLKVDVSVEN